MSRCHSYRPTWGPTSGFLSLWRGCSTRLEPNQQVVHQSRSGWQQETLCEVHAGQLSWTLAEKLMKMLQGVLEEQLLEQLTQKPLACAVVAAREPCTATCSCRLRFRLRPPSHLLPCMSGFNVDSNISRSCRICFKSS